MCVLGSRSPGHGTVQTVHIAAIVGEWQLLDPMAGMLADVFPAADLVRNLVIS